MRFTGIARLKNEGDRILFDNNSPYEDATIFCVADALTKAKRRKFQRNDDLREAEALLDRLAELVPALRQREP